MKKWGPIHLKKKMKGRSFKYTHSPWLCLFIYAATLKEHLTISRVTDYTPEPSPISVYEMYDTSA